MDSDEMCNLVDEYGRDIYNFCRYLAGSSGYADDLYQSTFLRAVELAHLIKVDKNPKAFLISLSVSQWKNYSRKQARRHRLATMDSIEVIDYDMVEALDNVEKEVIHKEDIRMLHEVMAQMKEKYRIPLIMYYNSELSITEIGKVLKCPQGTVKSRLSKAREQVRQGMEGLFYER